MPRPEPATRRLASRDDEPPVAIDHDYVISYYLH
jgi:hypothetical protein